MVNIYKFLIKIYSKSFEKTDINRKMKWILTFTSNKKERLLALSLLRTGRALFNASGSSIL